MDHYPAAASSTLHAKVDQHEVREWISLRPPSKRWTLDHAGHLCHGLAQRGYDVHSVEYRRVGDPGTPEVALTDVVSALGHVAELCGLHPSELLVAGHSAGGQLALAATAELGARGVLALAPIADVREAARANLGAGAVQTFFGETLRSPALGRQCPTARLPIGAPVVVVHGRDDEEVPFEMGETFARRAARAGDAVHFVALDCGHYEPIDPSSPTFEVVVASLDALARQEAASASESCSG